jgi:hypothetical protein
MRLGSECDAEVPFFAERYVIVLYPGHLPTPKSLKRDFFHSDYSTLKEAKKEAAILKEAYPTLFVGVLDTGPQRRW